MRDSGKWLKSGSFQPELWQLWPGIGGNFKTEWVAVLLRIMQLREMIGEGLEITPLSCLQEEDVGRIPGMLFQWLGIVRVYTKIPGGKADRDHPYTVLRGGTVEDICSLVHRDFAEKLKFARLWRKSDIPLTVSRHEIVEDGDMLELHL